MGVWGLIQIVFDIFLALGLGVCVLRVSRRPKDDPRLSRALQMLQSKIAVLEDLADRVDSQAARMSEMLQSKDREIQDKIDSADGRIQSLQEAVNQGVETVRLAQSSLKAEDILEKKSSAKYVEAARLAHEGYSIDDITRAAGLPRTEVEFIVKVNREPRGSDEFAMRQVAPVTLDESAPTDFVQIFETPAFDPSASPLSRLGEEFRRATQNVDMSDDRRPIDEPIQRAAPAAAMPQTFISSKASTPTSHLQKAANAAPVIRKVEFPRIDSSR